MAYPKLSEEKLREALAAVEEHPSAMAAARALGISRATLTHRVDQARARLGKSEASLELPEFPDDDISPREIIDTMKRRYEKRHEAHSAKQWFPIKVNIDGPIGILWFGDPHVDDDGCNWPLLDRHVEIARQEGIFGANIGDTTNNWSGRLARLFANQETSQGTARKLARWFLCESGVDWLIWILGNHDAWGDGSEILRLMGATTLHTQKLPMEDWAARFRLVFPNGREARINAAHNFPGHSMWNTLHGPQRAAHTKEQAHLYIAGHTHNWALHQEESASREFVYWLARARGYKFLDQYAENLGHAAQQEGAAILSVFDPEATSMTGFLTCFADPEEGASYLAWKRKKSCGSALKTRSRKAGGKRG